MQGFISRSLASYGGPGIVKFNMAIRPGKEGSRIILRTSGDFKSVIIDF